MLALVDAVQQPWCRSELSTSHLRLLMEFIEHHLPFVTYGPCLHNQQYLHHRTINEFLKISCFSIIYLRCVVFSSLFSILHFSWKLLYSLQTVTVLRAYLYADILLHKSLFVLNLISRQNSHFLCTSDLWRIPFPSFFQIFFTRSCTVKLQLNYSLCRVVHN